MRINGIRCDGCGREHLFDNPMTTFNSYSEMAPPDWFIVARGGREQIPWTFCSKKCIREHPLGEKRDTL
jgi:hypothetical protein